jgi:hypothetical protein
MSKARILAEQVIGFALGAAVLVPLSSDRELTLTFFAIGATTYIAAYWLGWHQGQGKEETCRD